MHIPLHLVSTVETAREFRDLSLTLQAKVGYIVDLEWVALSSEIINQN